MNENLIRYKLMPKIMAEGTKFKHNKTGNIYVVISSQVIECTNSREDYDYSYVVYTNGDKIFCREADEFYQKFTRL